jgi:hypothetical protein
VPAKITKLIGLKNKGGLSPINLVTFAVTQNGEWIILGAFYKIVNNYKDD